MGTYLSIVQIIIAVLLIAILLVQAQNSRASLFGGPSVTTRTRRGLEKVLFNFTIILSAVFILIAILNVRFG